MHAQTAITAVRSAKTCIGSFLSTRKAPSLSRRAVRQGKLVCRAAQAGAPGDGSLDRRGDGPPDNGKQGLDFKLVLSPEAIKALEGPKSVLSGIVNGYQNSLTKHPVATKALTSLIGFFLGDIAAQTLNPGVAFDAFRCVRLSLYGVMIDGPIGHFFYKFLDTRIKPDDPKGAQAVLTKTAIDQLIWAPAMTVVFLAFLTTLEGHPEAIWSVVQAKLVPIYLANLGVWPLWHIINFRYVPPEQRILFNNIVAIAWTTYLSYTCGAGGGHAGTPRDALAGGIPCATAAAAAILQSHHLADAVRQTNAVESVVGGWGADGLPNAEAGAQLLVNYANLKAEVVRTVCSLPPVDGTTLH